MSLGSWIKTLTAEAPPHRAEAAQIAESLLMELDYHIREAEAVMRAKEQEEQRSRTGVDYSWLVTKPPKPFEIPQLDRLELEEICMRVKPEESGRVIQDFRTSLLRDPTIEEIPRLMRACILQVLEGRPKEDTMTEWMMKSLTRLRPSTRVVPIGDDTSSTSSVDNVIELRSQQDGSPLFLRVDKLPV